MVRPVHRRLPPPRHGGGAQLQRLGHGGAVVQHALHKRAMGKLSTRASHTEGEALAHTSCGSAASPQSVLTAGSSSSYSRWRRESQHLVWVVRTARGKQAYVLHELAVRQCVEAQHFRMYSHLSPDGAASDGVDLANAGEWRVTPNVALPNVT